jgi:hypothetical protein
VDSQLPLVGRSEERRRLTLAFSKGDPLLILGPPGSGKTRLIQEARSSHEKVLYIAWERSLHTLLVTMARALIAVRHKDFLRCAGLKSGLAADPDSWLSAQTSMHLKGLLWTALESSPVPMVLDGITGARFPTYRFLQRIYHTRGMALYASARDAFDLGTLARLFWDPAKVLNLAPLHPREAVELFETAAGHFKLRDLDLTDFREKVLASAHGNPGQIIDMCRLATQPQYISGCHIKFSPLRIDAIIKNAR